jgi:thiosulfate/3-mercaptopyruvate sulfurtransferase
MRAALFALALVALPASAASDLGTTQKVGAGETVIDTRPLASCQAASLPGARCLPPAEFLGPRGALPNERDLLWLLGAAGLDGSERVVVTGDSASAREFVAGLLYLAGQREVRILDIALTPLVKTQTDAAPGQTRALVRSTIFTAPMRDHLWIVARHEIGHSPAILAADAYTAIRRFTRHLLETGEARRVGWALAGESR